MTRWLPIIALIVVWTPICSAAGQTGKGTYTNPVIDEIGLADPAVVRFEGTYYMYCTGDNSSYHVYTSRDLVHWTKGRRVFVPGGRNVWAPDVLHDPNVVRQCHRRAHVL
jgi:beta-xylosidase